MSSHSRVAGICRAIVAALLLGLSSTLVGTVATVASGTAAHADLDCWDGYYHVPQGVNFVNITAAGQAGHDGTSGLGVFFIPHAGGTGGRGAQVTAYYVPVFPGEDLYYGRAGDSDRGGLGGGAFSGNTGGNGGNGTFVAESEPYLQNGICQVDPSTVIVVAAGGGGGGGAGNAQGGNGGDAGIGGDPGGTNQRQAGGGGGAGTSTAGGAGGAAGHDNDSSFPFEQLYDNNGGNGNPWNSTRSGGFGAFSNNIGAGGGGGGGWYGGGGGGSDYGYGAGGGGGGSNYVSQLTDIYDFGFSSVFDPPTPTFTPTDLPSLNLTASANPVAAGSPVTFTATSSTPTMTGTVTFRDESGGLLTTATMAAGSASTTYTFPTNTQSRYHTIDANLDRDGTSAQLQEEVDVAPTIPSDGNPVDVTKTYGTAAVFAINDATGIPNPTYQWQISRDHGATYANISGETGRTISVFGSVADTGSMFRAVLTNGGGSVASAGATLTVTPAPITVTASSQRLNYGDTPAAVTPNISGLIAPETASYAGLSPNCSTSVTSSTHPGDYASSCTGPATLANYTVTYNNGGVEVDRAPLTITASSGTIVYGTTPTVTPNFSGWVNGDGPTTGALTHQPQCTTTATSTSSPGTYPTTCTGATSDLYNITNQAGSITVEAAPLTIRASSGTMQYGGTPPTITPQIEGFLNGDKVGALGTGFSCSTAATRTSHAGTYASSCSGAVDSNYSINYVNGSVSVTPAPLSITAPGGTMVYGSAPPTITPNISGFLNGDNAASLGHAFGCTAGATSASHVGSYTSSCSGAVDGDYTISYHSGSVTVTPAPLSITASGGTMVYGGTPPTITPGFVGFLNGDNAASLGNAFSCTPGATSTSHVGSYTSSCSGAVDGDYTISYHSGSVTVTAAPLTITADPQSRVFGLANPQLTATYSGFKNGQTKTSLSHQAVCTTTATPTSHPGSYAITCSQAASTDYSISYVSGTLTITKAPTTLVAQPANRLGFMTFSATLTRNADHAAVAGKVVTFTIGAQTLCSATTNSSGVASCTIFGAALLGPPYTATFAGDIDYLGSSAPGAFR